MVAGSMGDQGDGRSSARVQATFRVRYPTLDQLVVAFTSDLSKGGMFLQTLRFLPVNAVIRLHLELPDSGGEIEVIGRVAHVRDELEADKTRQPAGMGIQFLDLTDERCDQIARFIAARSMTEAEKSGPVELGALDVMVVDDDAEACDLLATPFLNRGDTVRKAANGIEALGLCLKRPPDVLLLDIEMPQMDGWQLLRIVRTRPSLSSVPVLFVTGLTHPEERLRGFRLGVDDYIPKPWRIEEVLARVDRIVMAARQGRGAAISRKTLRGDLAQVPIASVLSFLQLERMTGVLLLVNDRSARIYVQDGRPLRVEVERATLLAKHKALLFHLLSWTQGQFEFAAQEVACDDELGMSATTLLLEYSRLSDERHRPK
jgi:uncharacterized protein (TIGR02266 family)